MLSVVATPIGNLEDISFRALEALKKCDYIACEDTRRTKILLNRYDINTPLLSFHSHSSNNKVKKILDLLKDKKHVSLVSDAGTPGISDPGYKITSEASKIGIKIEPIPGPSAFLTALQAAGIPINKFIYLGFLPIKKGRKTLFEKLKGEDKTVVFYESPHRLLKTLKQIEEFLGKETQVILARELTKMHEEFLRGTAEELLKIFEEKSVKGEFVVILPIMDKVK